MAHHAQTSRGAAPAAEDADEFTAFTETIDATTETVQEAALPPPPSDTQKATKGHFVANWQSLGAPQTPKNSKQAQARLLTRDVVRRRMSELDETPVGHAGACSTHGLPCTPPKRRDRQRSTRRATVPQDVGTEHWFTVITGATGTVQGAVMREAASATSPVCGLAEVGTRCLVSCMENIGGLHMRAQLVEPVEGWISADFISCESRKCGYCHGCNHAWNPVAPPPKPLVQQTPVAERERTFVDSGSDDEDEDEPSMAEINECSAVDDRDVRILEEMPATRNGNPDSRVKMAVRILDSQSDDGDVRILREAPGSLTSPLPRHPRVVELERVCAIEARLADQREARLQRQQHAASEGLNGVTYAVKHAAEGDDVRFYYAAIEDLPVAYKRALRGLDIDDDGEISLSEMLHADHLRESLWKQLTFLFLVIGLMVGGTFGVSLLAATMAQTIDTAGGVLIANGARDAILATARAEDLVPVLLTPLLSGEQLGNVHQVSVSNLAYKRPDGSSQACTDCPKHVVMTVDVGVKLNDTYAKFLRSPGGMEIHVSKGTILCQAPPGLRGRPGPTW